MGRPILKRDAQGVHGTLYFEYADRRQSLPESKREVDWPDSYVILRSASCLPANVRACIWPCDSRRCRLVTRCRRSDDQPDYNCEQRHRAEACLLASSTYAAHMLFG